MYLVSIYFDEQTNKRIQSYINGVAKKTRNQYMLEGHVLPHITISAFETKEEEQAVEMLAGVAEQLQRGHVQWASAGQFFPYVIFIGAVLNEYLHEMSESIYRELSKMEGVVISPYYRPFQWLPHTTIAKKLSKEEMQVAFQTLQNEFGMFEGDVVRIGLAKTNPYRELVNFELK